MSEFRINDWVLDDEDNLFQVTRVRDDEISLVDEPYYVPAKEFRLWTPKENEWCWFYDYVIANNLEHTINGIGNLPSFIKDEL